MLTRLRFDYRFFTLISTTTVYGVPWKIQKQCELCHDPYICIGNIKYCPDCITKFHIFKRKEEELKV
jgi:hypothetical protein